MHLSSKTFHLSKIRFANTYFLISNRLLLWKNFLLCPLLQASSNLLVPAVHTHTLPMPPSCRLWINKRGQWRRRVLWCSLRVLLALNSITLTDMALRCLVETFMRGHAKLRGWVLRIWRVLQLLPVGSDSNYKQWCGVLHREANNKNMGHFKQIRAYIRE